MKKKKVLFIINPISGGRKKNSISSMIEKHLDHQLFDYEIVETEYAGHAAVLATENRAEKDILVAVGGDGTINEIAQALKGSNCCLGIIPQGSGNGLARHLGISLHVSKAIEQLNYSEEVCIDTAELNGHFFVSIAGIGFDSLIAEMFTQSKTRGFIGYASLSTVEFFKYQEQSYQLIVDGKKLERDAFLIAFANSNQFGYNTKISPKASLQDGSIDVCIVKKPRLDQMPLGMYQIWNAKAHESKLLEIIPGKEIQIKPNTLESANIDGESLKVGQEVLVKINPLSLKVWVKK